MSVLAALQRSFQDYVLQRTETIAERIEPGPRRNSERRLAIYHDGYRLRLIEALGTDYEALAAVMGDDAFRQACWAYVEATPSAFRNIRWYGGGLADFLQSTSPWSEQPWLSEVARFEWALTLAFDAADAGHVGFNELAALPPDAWGAVGFTLHPSVHFIRLRSNAPAARKALDALSN